MKIVSPVGRGKFLRRWAFLFDEMGGLEDEEVNNGDINILVCC